MSHMLWCPREEGLHTSSAYSGQSRCRAVQVTMCGEPFKTDNARDAVQACGAMVQLTRLLRTLRKKGPSASNLAVMWQPIEGPKV